MKFTCMAGLVLFYLAMTAGPAPAEPRSPFEEPVTARALYNYKAAKNHIEIIGLITTDTNGKVIIRTDPERPAVVYSTGSRIFVSHNGSRHEFKIIRVKNRKIVIKGGSQTFEVEVE